MSISIRALIAAALFSACAAVPAGAQPSAAADRPLFVDISAGIGAKPSPLTAGTTFTIFGEDGSAATEAAPGLSGLADVRVGYHVHPRIAIAAALSGSQSSVAAATTMSVPNPIRFNSPTILSLEAPESKRRELGVHVQASYALALTGAVMLTIAGGAVDRPSSAGDAGRDDQRHRADDCVGQRIRHRRWRQRRRRSVKTYFSASATVSACWCDTPRRRSICRARRA